jgi:DNA-binding transcriptional regulator YiaG
MPPDTTYPAWCARIRARLAQIRPEPTHAAIAEAVGVTPQTVGSWVRGESRPVGRALALGRFLGLEGDDLVDLVAEVEDAR